MLITTLTKTKRGAIVLPREVQKSWQDSDIYLRASGDTVILKKVHKARALFDEETRKKLKRLGKKITARDINDAIAWARSKTSR